MPQARELRGVGVKDVGGDERRASYVDEWIGHPADWMPDP